MHDSGLGFGCCPVPLNRFPPSHPLSPGPRGAEPSGPDTKSQNQVRRPNRASASADWRSSVPEQLLAAPFGVYLTGPQDRSGSAL